MEREAPYYGPRWSWTAIAMLFAPIVLFVYDAPRRFGAAASVEPTPICTIRNSVHAPLPVVRLLPECVCTGKGDPLCSEIPNQTCSP